jgi:hypothetical protein
MSNQNKQPAVEKGQMMTGFAILACIAILVISILAALFAWGDKDWTGGGTSLIAAAISAGFLLNAMTRR